jgi:hypothetical protein
MHLVLAFILLLAQPGGGAAGYAVNLNRAQAEAHVDSLGGDYIELKAKFQPHWATSMGIPGYDGRLARYTGQNVSRSLRRCFGIRRKLTSFEEDTLSISGWVDQQLLLAEIQKHEYWFAVQTTWRRSPLPYTDAIIEGIVSLMLSGREDSLSEHLASRLADIPNVVADARENVTDPIKLHCEVAAADLRAFVPALEAERLGDETAIDAGIVTQDVLRDARGAIEGFADFIDSLAVGGEVVEGLGAEEYASYLATAYMLEEPLEKVVDEAKRAMEQARVKKIELRGTTDREIIARLPDGSRPETDEDPADEYREGLGSALKRMEMLEILNVTSGDGLVEVSAWPPLVPAAEGLLYGRPDVSGGSPGGRILMQVAEHPARTSEDARAWRWAAVLLSSYPVLHPAEVRLLDHPSAVRRYIRSSMGRDGWDLYFSTVIASPVPVDGPEQLAKWTNLVYYAAAAIAEINIHTGEWNLDEAADFIAEKTLRERELALEDARRYAVAPGTGIGYLLGRREIIRLRERYKKFKRNSFDLKEFHDTLLSCGYLPPYLLSIEVMSKGMGRE